MITTSLLHQREIGSPFAVRLRYNNAIHNCFGFLGSAADDPQHQFGDQFRQNASYGYFEVRQRGREGVALQVYFIGGQQFQVNSHLILNGHFAAANGLEDGEELVLRPVKNVVLCNSVEVVPLRPEDWDTITSSAHSVEELFLSQIRLVRPGMCFLLTLPSRPERPVQLQVGRQNVLSSAGDAAFLLSMGTELLVAPPRAANEANDARSEQQRHTKGTLPPTLGNAEEQQMDGRLEDIRPFLEFAGPRPFRVLPSGAFSRPKTSCRNPFLAREQRIAALLDNIAFIFVLQEGQEKREEPTKIGWNSLRKSCVQIRGSAQSKMAAAILVELPRAERLQRVASGTALGLHESGVHKLAAQLEKYAECGLPHCWMSPELRKSLPHQVELTWIRVEPIAQRNLLRAPSVVVVRSTSAAGERAFREMVTSSREMYAPWLMPTTGGLALEVEVAAGQREQTECVSLTVIAPVDGLDNASPQDTGKDVQDEQFYCLWPLSPKIHVRFEQEGDDEERPEAAAEVTSSDPLLVDTNNSALPPNSQEATPSQAESIRALEASLCAAVKHCLLGDGRPLWHNTLLEGPVGSGRSTLLAKLAQQLREENSSSMCLVESRVVDCASAESLPSLMQSLREATNFLALRWPSVLLLDNFDAVVERVGAEGDEHSVQTQLRKVYKTLFDTVFSAPGQRKMTCSIVCVVQSERNLPQDAMHWNGRKVFTHKQRLREMDKRESLQLLQRLLERDLHPGAVPELRAFPLGTNLAGIADLLRVVQKVRLTANNGEGRVSEQTVVEAIAQTGAICRHDALGEAECRIGFAQIAGLSEAKRRLTEIFIWPNKFPELFARCGVRIGQRAILHGPSGCGKSMLIRALATEMGANVLSVKGPELLSKYIGQSEQNVRQLFARAKASRPCVVVFDEFDALAPQRGSDNAHVTDRVVNQLLTELDGFDDDTKDIYVVAATNRLDLVDKALLRPGRFDHKLHVDVPDLEERLAVLRFYTSPQECGIRLSNNCNLKLVAEQTNECSRAELRAIVQSAFWAVERERSRQTGEEEGEAHVCQRHLQSALDDLEGRRANAGRRRDLLLGASTRRVAQGQRLTLD